VGAACTGATAAAGDRGPVVVGGPGGDLVSINDEGRAWLEGALGDTALVIEPAAGSEIAPVIAGRLHLAAHTVRDHLQAPFGKAGVSSRGELVATLFAEYHAPVHLAPGAHEAAGMPPPARA